jgi:hypothetical protein
MLFEGKGPDMIEETGEENRETTTRISTKGRRRETMKLVAALEKRRRNWRVRRTGKAEHLCVHGKKQGRGRY